MLGEIKTGPKRPSQGLAWLTRVHTHGGSAGGRTNTPFITGLDGYVLPTRCEPSYP